ncbi:MAG TPA: DUF2269 domain-containing protein [Desulfotomaculum sp.]|nr:MAG: hypothetical protein VR67_03715 [Peptococcaceae bacterium BRH_c8a]HBX23328.1 DUF2269 domain-containing protein [Desulfotomaculum sp.]
MLKLSLGGQKILKSIHIILVCTWIGAGVSMIILGFAKEHIINGDELYAFNACIKFIDDFIVIPAAIGTLLTGLLFSWLTNWGFFKFNWVVVKWVATVAQILFGTFFLGPWTNGSTAIADAERLQALQNPTYLYFSQMNQYFGVLQVSLLIAVVFVSVFKPWGKNTKKINF